MTDSYRTRLERLISDSNAFHAGQEEERRRLQLVIDCRIDELRLAGSVPHISAVCAELLRIRQSLDPC